MKKTRPIYNLACTELQTLFYSPIAWLILIIFTVQSGIVFTSRIGELLETQSLGYRPYNCSLHVFGGYGGLFSQVLQYLYLYIPLLTMNLISREYNSGSIKLLYSSPLTNAQIILGKYLSMLIYGLVMIGILTAFSLFAVVKIDQADVTLILSGLLGLYLLICAYAAIGLFMSSITTYQVVAAIGTFTVLAVLNMIGGMWQDIEFVRDLTYWLSINGRAATFVSGLICSEDVLYFVIVTLLFLALSIIRLKAARQKSRFNATFMKYFAVVAATLLLGYLSSRPKLMSFYDATRTKANTLTPNSQDIVSRMDGGLTITTYVNILDDMNRAFRGFPSQVNEERRRFRQYTRFKPEIKMRYYYYYHHAPDNAEMLDKQYPDLSDRERMMKLTSIYRLDSTKFHRPEEVEAKIDLSPEKFRFTYALERENGQRTFLRLFDDPWVFPAEREISAAFKRLVMELPLVGFLKGHGERDCIREGDRDYNRFAQDKPFRYSLINNGFDFTELTLENEIPDKVKILVIADMRNPLTPDEDERLDRYIARGGNLLIAGEPRRQEVMNPLIERFGVQLMPGRLVKLSENFQPDFILSKPTEQATAFSYILEEMNRRKRVATMPSVTGLSYTADCGFTVTPLLTCDSVGTWNELETTDFVDDTVRLNPQAGETVQPYVTMLALSRPLNGKEQKIIILGDADCLSNGEINISRKGFEAANYSLVDASFYWLSDEEVPVNVTRPSPPDRKVFLSLNSIYWWKIFWIGALPALMLFFALFIWIRRRGK
ncbi:MAG: Gldg family protein [Dysgonamonadaceae bacterium]|jgi:ABC-2 type transport system permease protein|nr:Gldg family protein [Dysgonamonadaceae bacterium]